MPVLSSGSLKSSRDAEFSIMDLPTPKPPFADTNAILARQPIYDRKLRVYGYELLYRANARQAAVFDDNRASSQVVIHSMMDAGIDNVVGKYRAFINMNRTLFVEGLYEFLPSDRMVLEVLEHVPRDEELIESVHRASRAGYRIALDDFTFHAGEDPLLDVADIVKVEIPALTATEIADHGQRLRERKVKLLAEKVEDYDTYDLCRNSGYDLFQGFFFCRPRTIAVQRTPVDRSTLLRILARVYDSEASIEEIEALIQRDASLTYRLLRYVNSAIYAPTVPIDSLQHAIVFLGMTQVQAAVVLLLLSGIDDKPRELMTTAAVRARMCQLVGESLLGRDAPPFFLVGLLSALDAFLDRPLPELIQELPIGNEVASAVLRRSGIYGEALKVVLDWERGVWQPEETSTLALEEVQQHYWDAIRWAADFCNDVVA